MSTVCPILFITKNSNSKASSLSITAVYLTVRSKTSTANHVAAIIRGRTSKPKVTGSNPVRGTTVRVIVLCNDFFI